MALAYIVLAHRDPEQVARLVGRLGSEDDAVYVHVDRKVDISPFREAFSGLDREPALLAPRVALHWSGYGHVAATMLGIETVLRSGVPVSHILLLTGQDYPIRPEAEIRRWFSDSTGLSFLSWSAGIGQRARQVSRKGNPEWVWSGDQTRLRRWHFRWRGVRRQFPPPHKPLSLVRRRLPRGLVPYQGLAYWALTPDAAKYVLDRVRQRPSLRWFFHFVFGPDEFIFQTILLASPLRDTLVNEDLRFMNWEEWHPSILTIQDLDDMISSDKLFARKFDPQVDHDILDELDRRAAAHPATPRLQR